MGFIGEDISPNQEVINMPLLVEWLLQVHMKPFVCFSEILFMRSSGTVGPINC